MPRPNTPEFAEALVVALREIRQFLVVYEHNNEPAATWAPATPYPWLGKLDAEEIAEFTGQLLPALAESAAAGDLTEFLGTLRAWESTAETYDDPELLAATGSGGTEVVPESERRLLRNAQALEQVQRGIADAAAGRLVAPPPGWKSAKLGPPLVDLYDAEAVRRESGS